MWNLKSCNKSYEKFLKRKTDSQMHRKISRAKSMVDNSQPTSRPHLHNNLRKKRLTKGNCYSERHSQIDIQNKLLLQKMVDLDRKPSELNPSLSIPKMFFRNSSNLSRRLSMLETINSENKRIFSRLKSTKSEYSLDKENSRHSISRSSSKKTTNKSIAALARISLAAKGVLNK